MYKKGFFGFVFNHAIKEYKSLFKASIILMSVTLISLSQGFSVLTKYDYEAKKLEYLIVTQENTPLLKVKCKEIAKNNDSCMLAQYQLSYNTTINKVAALVTVLALFLSCIFMFVSIIAYHQKYKTEKEEDEKKHNKALKRTK